MLHEGCGRSIRVCIISAATQYDTAITLALIEDANKKVSKMYTFTMPA